MLRANDCSINVPYVWCHTRNPARITPSASQGNDDAMAYTSFTGLACRNLRRRPARSILAATGIGIAVAGFVSLTGLSQGMERAFVATFVQRDTHIVAIRGRTVEIMTATLDEALGDRMRAVGRRPGRRAGGRGRPARARPQAAVQRAAGRHFVIVARLMTSSRGKCFSRYALPPSNSGSCFPARMPLPEVSP